LRLIDTILGRKKHPIIYGIIHNPPPDPPARPARVQCTNCGLVYNGERLDYPSFDKWRCPHCGSNLWRLPDWRPIK